ncbi:MAG TPA: spore coat protein [Bacillota bacterium]|mgnify:FL=1|jgi:spore coat protein CotF|nr:spore coat protein [Bacillota bacterium]
MPSLLNALTGVGKQANDEMVANDMLLGAEAAASAYLMAILKSSTPELRTMYSSALTQILAGHGAMMNLAVTRGWYRPYEKPGQRLAESYRQSETVISQSAH